MVQSSPWFDLAIQMAQRNLMKRRYLVVTRCKLTLYYQWSLEARENESKEARAHDPGGPYIGGKLRVDLWGEKVVCDWKGSKQLESLENHTFQEASRHLHLLCVSLTPLGEPSFVSRTPFTCQVTFLLLANTTPHQDVPKRPQLGAIPTDTWQPSIWSTVHSLSILNPPIRHLWCDLIQTCPLTGPVSSELFSPAWFLSWRDC